MTPDYFFIVYIIIVPLGIAGVIFFKFYSRLLVKYLTEQSSGA